MEPIEAYQFHVNLRLPKTYIIYTEEATRAFFGEVRQGIDEAVAGLIEGSYLLRQTTPDEPATKSTMFIEMMEAIVNDSNYPYMGSPDCQQLLSFIYKYCMYQNALMGSSPTNPAPLMVMAKPVAYDLVYGYACHLYLQSPFKSLGANYHFDQTTGLPFVTQDAPFGLAFDPQHQTFMPIVAKSKLDAKRLQSAINLVMDMAIKAKFIQDQRVILQSQFSKRDGLLDMSVVKDYFVERKRVALHGAIDLDALIAGESKMMKIPSNGSTGALTMELEELEKLEKHSDPFIAKQREDLLFHQQREMDRQAKAIAQRQQIAASMSIDGTPLGFTAVRPQPPVLYVQGSMTPNETRYVKPDETVVDMRTGVEAPADKIPDDEEGEIYNAVGNGEKPFILENGPDSMFGVDLVVSEEATGQFQSFVGPALYDLNYTTPLDKGVTLEKTDMTDMKASRLPSQNGLFGNFQAISLGQQQIIKGVAGINFPIPRRVGRVMLPPGKIFSINTQATSLLGTVVMPGAVGQSIIVEHDGEVAYTLAGQPVQTMGVEDCSRVLVLRDYFNNPIYNQGGYPIMYRDMTANGQPAVEIISVTETEKQYAQQNRHLEYLKTALQQVDQFLLGTHLQAGGQTILPALALQAGFQMPMAAKNLADYRINLLGTIQPNGAAVDQSVLNMNQVTSNMVNTGMSHEEEYLANLTNRARNANNNHRAEAAQATQRALTLEEQAVVNTALGFTQHIAATAQNNLVPMDRAEIISIPQAAINPAHLPVEPPAALVVVEEVAAPVEVKLDGVFTFTLKDYFYVNIDDEVLPACWLDEAPIRAPETRSFNGQLNFASEEFRVAIAFIDGMATEFLVNVEAFDLMDRSKHNPIYELSLQRGEYLAHATVDIVEPVKAAVPTIKVDLHHEIMQPASREALIAEGMVRANNGLANPTVFDAEYEFILPVGPIPQNVLADAWEATKEANPGVRYFNYVLTVGTTLKEAGFETVSNYIDSVVCNWWNIVLTQRLSAVGSPDDVWMSDFCNPETVTDLLAYLKDEGLTQEAMALFAKEVPALLNLVNSTPEGESARFARLTLAQAEAAEQARIDLLKNEDGDIDESYGEGPYSEEMKFWMSNRYCSLLNIQTAAKVLVADAAEEVFTLGRLTYTLNPDFYGIVNSTFAKLPDLAVLEVVTGLGQHLQIVRDEAKPFDMYFIVGATKVGK